MNTINISGLTFKKKPSVTVREVIDVFKAYGKIGILQRNGITEYLDSEIEFNTPFPYQFIYASQISTSFRCNFAKTKQLKQEVTKAEASHDIRVCVSRKVNVTIRALHYKCLLLNQIEVFSGDTNLTANAVLSSSDFYNEAIECPPEKAVNGNIDDENDYFRSTSKGGWLCLSIPGFNTISKVVVRQPTDVKLRAELPNADGATLSVSPIHSYVVYQDITKCTFYNSYPEDEVTAICIIAGKGRLLKMQRIEISDNEGLIIPHDKIHKFDSSNLDKTRFDKNGLDLLFCCAESSNDYVVTTSFGGFLKLYFDTPKLIKSVFIKSCCCIQGLRLSMETERFSCSLTSEPKQEYCINE